MPAPRLLTLPQLAKVVGVEYRTLHSWLGRGLLQPSMQSSPGSGVPNLFSTADAVGAKVIADLRRSGLGLDLLDQAAERLRDHPRALTDGAMILVNGSVDVVDPKDAFEALQRESLSVVYNTGHAIRDIDTALSAT